MEIKQKVGNYFMSCYNFLIGLDWILTLNGVANMA